MDERDWLVEQFDAHRSHLRAVAYRMLGSLSEADDAVQEAWIRLSRANTTEVENLRAWLTTVIGRVCLNMLRSRSRRDVSVPHLPDPIVTDVDGEGPEHDALMADSVGLALLVVLETLGPAERLAFVLHDVFAVPFDEIAQMVGRSPMAARQLASRARHRVQGAARAPDADVSRQRAVVDAFFAAARAGDFEALVRLLDPEVEARTDAVRPEYRLVRGASNVAQGAVTYARPTAVIRPALVNGAAGVVVLSKKRPVAVIGFTVRNGRIVALDAITNQKRLRRLDLSFLETA